MPLRRFPLAHTQSGTSAGDSRTEKSRLLSLKTQNPERRLPANLVLAPCMQISLTHGANEQIPNHWRWLGVGLGAPEDYSPSECGGYSSGAALCTVLKQHRGQHQLPGS